MTFEKYEGEPFLFHQKTLPDASLFSGSSWASSSWNTPFRERSAPSYVRLLKLGPKWCSFFHINWKLLLRPILRYMFEFILWILTPLLYMVGFNKCTKYTPLRVYIITKRQNSKRRRYGVVLDIPGVDKSVAWVSERSRFH